METKDILKKLRSEKKLTLQEVATQSGVSYSAYQKYELGIREIGAKSLGKLADFYGVTTDYLLGRPEAKPPEDPVDLVAREAKLKAIEKELMEEYLQLPLNQREHFVEFLEKLLAKEAARKGLALQPDGLYVKVPDTNVAAKISALERQNQELLARMEAMEKEEALLEKQEKSEQEQKVHIRSSH